MAHKRVCGTCGGKVHLVSAKDTIDHPARDERGRYIYDRKLDRATGQMMDVQVMITHPIRGLGTWHCENNCKDRQIKVKRFVGAGKEEERLGNGEKYTVNDSFIREVPVTRHIPVVFA
jgi:hypothetical protein